MNCSQLYYKVCYKTIAITKYVVNLTNILSWKRYLIIFLFFEEKKISNLLKILFYFHKDREDTHFICFSKISQLICNISQFCINCFRNVKSCSKSNCSININLFSNVWRWIVDEKVWKNFGSFFLGYLVVRMECLCYDSKNILKNDYNKYF